MKKYKLPAFLSVLILFIAFSSWHVCAASALEFEGEGTREKPYLIQNERDLCYFRDLVNNGTSFENVYFRQTTNIRMNQKSWIPIGTDEHYFSGIYDGSGHFIENMNICSPPPPRKQPICRSFWNSRRCRCKFGN